ncbi:MAG: hypothetical protein JNL74_23615, partial [Fibrobacteres bacterium]|nr:hypothetical protein [Fibrobacterota bacterium]
IPQTKLRNAIYEAAKPVTEECHQTETEYDKYLKAQQKKRKVLIIVAAAVVACAVLLYGLKVI